VKPLAAAPVPSPALPPGKTSRYSLTVNDHRYEATVEILN
jgi:hypothetical protein